jgi:hypothetical protein
MEMQVESLVAVYPDIRGVYISSLGGSLKAALALGRSIRRHQLNTMVGSNKICASACVWAFAGGVNRTAAGVLAVHQFYSPKGQDIGESDTQEEVATVGEYLDEMGVSRTVLDVASLVKPDEIQPVSFELAREWRLDNSERLITKMGEAQKRGWSQFTTMRKDGSPWYVNWGMIQTDSFGHVTVWAKHSNKNGNDDLWHIEFDSRGHARDLSYVRYDRAGDMIFSDSQPKAWMDMVPDTVNQDLYRTVMAEPAH